MGDSDSQNLNDTPGIPPPLPRSIYVAITFFFVFGMVGWVGLARENDWILRLLCFVIGVSATTVVVILGATIKKVNRLRAHDWLRYR